jgi:hypothetical protein
MKTYDLSDKERRGGGPYSISFCYPQNGDPFVVKGRRFIVDDKIKKLLRGVPAVVHHRCYFEDLQTFFDPATGKKTMATTSVQMRYEIVHKYGYGKIRISDLRWIKQEGKSRQRYELFARTKTGAFTKMFRKVPRSWIKELNPIIKQLEEDKADENIFAF